VWFFPLVVVAAFGAYPAVYGTDDEAVSMPARTVAPERHEAWAAHLVDI
jgi:hypothetical protein